MLWPGAQALNFYYLSPRFRVLYLSSVSLVWDCFLSFMKHKETKVSDMQLKGDLEKIG